MTFHRTDASNHDSGSIAADATNDAHASNIADLSRNIQKEWIALSKVDRGNQTQLADEWHNYLSAVRTDIHNDNPQLANILNGCTLTGATKDGALKVRNDYDGKGETEAVIDANGHRAGVQHTEGWGGHSDEWSRTMGPTKVSIAADGTPTYRGAPQNLDVLAEQVYRHYMQTDDERVPASDRNALVKWLEKNNPNLDYTSQSDGSRVGVYTQGAVRLPNLSEFANIEPGS